MIKDAPTRKRLSVDCFGVKHQLISDIAYVHEFMEELTKRIDMRVLVPPIIVSVPVVNAVPRISTENDYGLSGVVVYLESSASIHTWPEKEFLSVDIYTCKAFNSEYAIDIIKTYFKPECIEISVDSLK